MTDQPKMIDVELFVAMNESGDSYVATDECDASEGLLGDFGGSCIRTAKITVRMRPPVASEASVTVPDEAGQTVETEAA